MEYQELGSWMLEVDQCCLVIMVIQSHKDNVVTCPKDFVVTSVDPNDGIIQSIESHKLKRYGVQFHPEGLQHSEGIIKNFIKICKQLKQLK